LFKSLIQIFIRKIYFKSVAQKHIYRVRSLNGVGTRMGSMEEVEENKKVLYYTFAIFAIVNELLKIAI